MSQIRASDSMAAGPSRSRSFRIVPSAKPSVPPQLLLMELKHRILSALSKLADRDTQQIAVEELDKIVQTLPPDCVSACLSCLYDSDVQQKSVVKKECIRLFGTLALLHGDLLAPHLPKILVSIMRRLRDPDTGVRDACIDTIGLLSGQFLSRSGPENGNGNGTETVCHRSRTENGNGTETVNHRSRTENGNGNGPETVNQRSRMETGNGNGSETVNQRSRTENGNRNGTETVNLTENGTHGNAATMLMAFVKPLFDALSEQNKGVQAGAALCLARLIETATDLPPSTMQRLCLRISKFLSNPNFLAKAALLPVFGSLSQVGAVSQQHLAVLMPSMKEALESNDWATRKAAAETLGRLGSNLGPALTNFKDSILLVLESCRFDKVKPVRDSIQETIQLWKNLAGTQMDGPIAGGNIDTTSSEDHNLSMGNFNLKSPSLTSSDTVSVAEVPKTSQPPGDVNSNEKSRQTAEKLAPAKKRIPTLTDRKPNLDFFQNLETRNSDDWQIEVAVPRKCLQTPSLPRADEDKYTNEREQDFVTCNAHKGLKRADKLVDSSLLKNDAVYDHKENFEKRLGEFDSHSDSGDVQINTPILDGNAAGSSSGNHISEARQYEASMWSDMNLLKRVKGNLSWDAADHATRSANSRSYKEEHESHWFLLQSQLSQLEIQQSDLMEMLQDFMSSSQETMFALEARVRGLERVVEELAQNLVPPSRSNMDATRYDGGNYFIRPNCSNHKLGKGVDAHSALVERQISTGADIAEAKALREWTWKGSSDFVSEDWVSDNYGSGKANPLGNMIDDHDGSRRGNSFASTNRRASKDDIDHEQMINRRGWDRGSGPTRLGEGPSARSVWQASKDEATLAAIRVVAEDAGALETEAPSSEVSELITPTSASESIPYKAEGQEKRQLWCLWRSIMDHVRVGDTDSAYSEVLCNGDELMLVRLLSKTGPVLEQLSASTATEVLHVLAPLLQQQSFFDFVIPWVQKAADMVVENGPECLDISYDVKKELLFSLQETASMDMPEGWVGNTVDELLEQLTNAWSVDLMRTDHNQ